LISAVFLAMLQCSNAKMSRNDFASEKPKVFFEWHEELCGAMIWHRSPLPQPSPMFHGFIAAADANFARLICYVFWHCCPTMVLLVLLSPGCCRLCYCHTSATGTGPPLYVLSGCMPKAFGNRTPAVVHVRRWLHGVHCFEQQTPLVSSSGEHNRKPFCLQISTAREYRASCQQISRAPDVWSFHQLLLPHAMPS